MHHDAPDSTNISDSTHVIRVPLVLTELELNALTDLMPELKDGLSVRWPVKDISLAKPTRRRNPFHPNQIEAVAQ